MSCTRPALWPLRPVPKPGHMLSLRSGDRKRPALRTNSPPSTHARALWPLPSHEASRANPAMSSSLPVPRHPHRPAPQLPGPVWCPSDVPLCGSRTASQPVAGSGRRHTQPWQSPHLCAGLSLSHARHGVIRQSAPGELRCGQPFPATELELRLPQTRRAERALRVLAASAPRSTGSTWTHCKSSPSAPFRVTTNCAYLRGCHLRQRQGPAAAGVLTCTQRDESLWGGAGAVLPPASCPPLAPGELAVSCVLYEVKICPAVVTIVALLLRSDCFPCITPPHRGRGVETRLVPNFPQTEGH